MNTLSRQHGTASDGAQGFGSGQLGALASPLIVPSGVLRAGAAAPGNKLNVAASEPVAAVAD